MDKYLLPFVDNCYNSLGQLKVFSRIDENSRFGKCIFGKKTDLRPTALYISEPINTLIYPSAQQMFLRSFRKQLKFFLPNKSDKRAFYTSMSVSLTQTP